MGDLAPTNLCRAVDEVRTSVRMIGIAKAYRDEPANRVVDIAETFGVSKGTVLRAARRAGLPKRSRRTFDDETREDVLSAYKSGMPLSDIARKFAVSQAVICKWRDEAGLNKRRTP